MKIGFTGTQVGMSLRQRRALYKHLCDLIWGEPHECHEGDCVGADDESIHEVAKLKRAGHNILVHTHPPIDPKKRAFHATDVLYKPEPYLVRNHAIVDVTDILIAAPRTNKEERRSGTWATIRYAESLGKKVIRLAR